MADEKVSVIVPVYNVEKYLRRCLDSIINQTYQNLEIILVDDGSPDNSGAICDEYAAKDQRIRVIHQENGGVSAARNAAICVASGEYVMFVDSDDCVSLEYVANMMDIDDTDLLISGCLVQNSQYQWHEWRNQAIHTTLSEIKQNPELINCIPCGIVVSHRYKRALLTKNHLLFRTDITRGEDTLFNSEYLAVCDTIVVTERMDYFYYYTGTSATSRFNPNLFYWSMESVLKIGQIIGMDNDVFYGRAWNNAMTVCDNYFQTAKVASYKTKRQMIRSVFEVCSNSYVRRSLSYAMRKDNRKKAILVQFYLYPFLPFLYAIYSGIRNLFKRG